MSAQPVDMRPYFGDAAKVTSLSLTTLKTGAWRWEAFVYARQPGKRSKLVYRRRCLNETHARKVAADTAKRFEDHLARTGSRWEDRHKGAALARCGGTP